MARGLKDTLFRMAASAAILLSGIRVAQAEVCDKAYMFDYTDLIPVNGATEFLMFAAGPTGGLIVFFVGLFLVTRRPGVLLGLSSLLAVIGLADILSSRDDVAFTFMIQEGCEPAHSVVGPIFLAVAAAIAALAVIAMRRRTAARI